MNSSASSAPQGRPGVSPDDSDATHLAKEDWDSNPGSLKSRREKLTKLMFRLTGATTLMSAVSTALVPPGLNLKSAISLGTGFLLLGVIFLCIRLRRHDWAARLFTYPAVALLCWVIRDAGGLNSGVAFFFLPLLIFAQAALSSRELTLFTAATASAILFISYSESEGLLQAAYTTPPYLAWLQLVLALGMSALLLHGILDTLLAAQREVQEASLQHRVAQSRYVTAQKLEPVAQLASGIAHDFNNLLGVIANVSSSLRIEMTHTDSSNELLDDLDEATARASLMTGQLLAFSRRRALEIEVIDLDEFVRSLTPLLGRLLGDEILVDAHGTTRGLTVHADRGQLEQVMLNLVVNARDAMPHGGRLVIELGVNSDDSVFIAVKDSGVGIPEELQSKIFTAFFTTKSTGTGLGLATVADIVERLRGTIQVESVPGSGATFKLSLPASTTPASAVRRSLSRFRTQRHTARILLAEDHELMRRGTVRVLEQAGYTITSVVNGQEALALIQGGAGFDLLLTDVSMPHLTGFDLVERLARIDRAMPTVFISGDARQVPAHFEKLPFPIRFLAKPFAQEDLIDAIEKCLERSSPEILSGV